MTASNNDGVSKISDAVSEIEGWLIGEVPTKCEGRPECDEGYPNSTDNVSAITFLFFPDEPDDLELPILLTHFSIDDKTVFDATDKITFSGPDSIGRYVATKTLDSPEFFGTEFNFCVAVDFTDEAKASKSMSCDPVPGRVSVYFVFEEEDGDDEQ